MTEGPDDHLYWQNYTKNKQIYMMQKSRKKDKK